MNSASGKTCNGPSIQADFVLLSILKIEVNQIIYHKSSLRCGLVRYLLATVSSTGGSPYPISSSTWLSSSFSIVDRKPGRSPLIWSTKIPLSLFARFAIPHLSFTSLYSGWSSKKEPSELRASSMLREFMISSWHRLTTPAAILSSHNLKNYISPEPRSQGFYENHILDSIKSDPSLIQTHFWWNLGPAQNSLWQEQLKYCIPRQSALIGKQVLSWRAVFAIALKSRLC